jgi:hypothetical protein
VRGGRLTTPVGEGEIDGLLRGLVLVDVAPSIEVAGIEKITAFMRSGMDGFESLHDVADAIAAHNLHHTQWPRTRLGVMEGAAVAARAIRVPTLLIRGAEVHVNCSALSRDHAWSMSPTLDTWSPAMTTTSSLQRSKGFFATPNRAPNAPVPRPPGSDARPPSGPSRRGRWHQ